MYALLCSVSRTQLTTSGVKNRLLLYDIFIKLAQFQIHPPPLNILTVRNWLTVKIHYSLIETEVKI
jgi:hypothetical protein